jgi:transketolase
MTKTAELISMRDAFGDKLLAMSREHDDLYVLDGDLATSTKLDKVAELNPERFLQMGIAEQNMLGVAAGMAAAGLQPWVCTFAAFLVKRALDQIAVSIAQPMLDVKLIGAYSGLLTGCTGKTHQGLEDIAIMRSLPGMTVLAPADAAELESMMEFARAYKGPVYIRVARDAYPAIFDSGHRFEPGKGVWLREGSDLTIIATGTQTSRALEAVDLLAREGVSAALLHLPSIKPIDRDAIGRAARLTGAIVTAEEHSVIGGLGGAVAEVLVETDPVPMERVGVMDLNSESGPNDELLRKYGLTPADIAEKAKAVLARKAGRQVSGCAGHSTIGG